jgi:PAS domain S-box-containing protein
MEREENITERKRVEEALRESEERFRQCFENANIGMCLVDLEMHLMRVNPKMAEIFGYTQGEMEGRRVNDFTHPEDQGVSPDFIHRAASGETQNAQFTKRYFHKQGHVLWGQVSSSLVRDTAGKPLYFISHVQDITERKRIEEALRRSEEHFRALTENSLDGVIVVDKKGIITYVSPSIERVMGYKPEELIGESGFNFIALADLPRAVIDFGKAVLITDSIVPNAFRVRHKDGSERILEGVGRSLFDNPAVAGFVMNARDVTERKRIEEVLQESEEKYRLLVQNANVGILVLQDGLIRFANPRALSFSGYSEEELASRPFLERVHPDDRENMVERYRQRIAGKRDQAVYVFRFLDREGRTRWVEINSIPITWKGKPAVLSFLNDIEERRKAEEALRESEAMSRAVIEHSPVGISVRDQAGALLQVNEAWKKIWAISDAEIQENEKWSAGRSWKERCPYLGDSGQDVDRLFTPECGVSILYLPELKIPEPRPGAAQCISMYLYALRNQEGQVEKVVTLTQDISERRKTEEALRKNEAKYRELVENANSIILRRDPEGRITFFNEFAQRFFGFREEEILGRNVVGTIVPEKESSGRDLAQMIRDISRHPERYATNENENVLRNGERVWVAWTNKPILDPDGKLAEILCIGNDITGRKRAEERLAESEVKYRTLVQGMSEAVMQVDNDDRVQFVNPQFCQMIGYREDELLGRVGYEIYFDPEEQELIRRKNRLRREKASDAYETRMRKKTGEEVLVRISGSPVADALGNVVGSIGVITDITERKLLEAEFLQAQKMEALGRLAGGVAHDFNNLLTSIMGYSDLLAKKLAEDDPSGPQRRWADNILSSANRAANLTQQLLSLSRRHAAQMLVLDLNGVVAEVERMLRRVIGEDIELTIHSEGTLGRVKADPIQIEQVLMNLAVNARDAMPGGGKLSIETKNVVLDKSYARRRKEVAPGPYVMIAVSDTGHGMDAEVQSHLFEPFFTTKEKGKGTGLGLSTAYGIVKQTGGHIEVVSAPGKGSAFKIYLPRTEEPPALLSSPQPQPPGPVEAELPRGVETVLLVEDEETVRSLARDVLRDAGYTVLEAGDGEEALRVAGSHPGPIHLLLTDVIMPRLGGPELARRLQPLRPDMRVLFMSGYTDGDISSYGGLGTETSLLQKPFQPIVLARRVREVLEAP